MVRWIYWEMRGERMADAKTGRLYWLYGWLRYLKQSRLPVRLSDPVEQARHDLRVRAEIERVEREIEEEMGG